MRMTHTNIKSRRVVSNIIYTVGIASLVIAFAISLTTGGRTALAAPLQATAPGLGAAGSYSALGKAGVTNSGASVLSGNVGADTSVTNFGGAPQGTAAAVILAPDVNGAEGDALTAYGALSQGIDASLDLAGTNTVTPGVYDVGATSLNGTLILSGAGVYIFRSTSSVSISGTMLLNNGADACNVFWQIPISMDISAGANFAGTIIANSGSITFGDSVTLNGRALALVGSVTLLNDHIYGPNCAPPPQPETTSTTVPVLNAATGVDQTPTQLPWIQIGLGVFGLSLLGFGFALRRKNVK